MADSATFNADKLADNTAAQQAAAMTTTTTTTTATGAAAADAAAAAATHDHHAHDHAHDHAHGRYGHLSPEHMRLHRNLGLAALFIIIFAQMGVHWWKARHPNSFNVVSLAGIWAIPAVLAAANHFWRFIFLWLAFTAVAGQFLFKATRTPLDPETPRAAYKWFHYVYRASFALVLVGYTTVCLEVLGVFRGLWSLWSSAEYEHSMASAGILLLFYGLYYAVVLRDCAAVASTKMASTMGYFSKDEEMSNRLDPTVCGICNQQLRSSRQARMGGDLMQPPATARSSKLAALLEEKVHKLNCGHEYHDFCVRGWSIIGKKDMCPKCGEKVELKQLLTHEWQLDSVLYIQLLDLLHYLLVWNPIIITAIKGMTMIFDPEHA